MHKYREEQARMFYVTIKIEMSERLNAGTTLTSSLLEYVTEEEKDISVRYKYIHTLCNHTGHPSSDVRI
jgi:hypothetical protein